MAKQTIEIDVPDGMRVSEIKEITATGYAVHLAPIPKTKWRPPTKLDLLNVDSIRARVRTDGCCGWKYREIRAVATCGMYRYLDTDGVIWKHAEIEVPAGETPPREAWVRY